MPWLRLDDGFLMHTKTQAAAAQLGRGGLGRVLVVWVQGVDYANKYLTDGYLPSVVVAKFHDDTRPLQVADALVASGLWEATDGGFTIHDYLDYNVSRQAVLEKREKDRRRKRDGGDGGDSGEIPPPFRPDSTDVPCGVGEENSAPAGTRARAPLPIPLPTPTPGRGAGQEVPPQTGAGGFPTSPLGRRARVDVAWPGRPPVPGPLHCEFRMKLGEPEDVADQKLRAWYPTVAAVWEGKPIGDSDWDFWRARFREWVGTTVTKPDKLAERKAAERAFLAHGGGAA